MDCDHCGGELVGFDVPADLREFAPGGAGAATLCATCLRVEELDSDAVSDGDGEESRRLRPTPNPDFTAVVDTFPSDRGGVVAALLLGKLDSLAMNREAVSGLADEAERAGVDVFLLFDRVAADPSLDPHFDVERRREQVETFLS
jgi:hypothetical protein